MKIKVLKESCTTGAHLKKEMIGKIVQIADHIGKAFVDTQNAEEAPDEAVADHVIPSAGVPKTSPRGQAQIEKQKPTAKPEAKTEAK
jgi:hypothetical protein